MSKNPIFKFARIVVATMLAGSVSTANAISPMVPAPSIVSSDLTMMPWAYSDELMLNSPVKARITSKTIQKLYDGNQIIQIEETLMYRDSKGRIRREAHHSNAGDNLSVSITNHKENTVIILDPAGKVAFESPGIGNMFEPGALGGHSMELGMIPPNSSVIIGSSVIIDSSVVELAESLSIDQMLELQPAETITQNIGIDGSTDVSIGNVASLDAMFLSQGTFPDVVRPEVTPLGQDRIGSIRVEGTKYKTTYPADSFGNVNPIIVKREVWFSPELRMMLKSELEDPRMGTISYSVELINQDEPDESLFEVPSDYSYVSMPRLSKVTD